MKCHLKVWLAAELGDRDPTTLGLCLRTRALLFIPGVILGLLGGSTERHGYVSRGFSRRSEFRDLSNRRLDVQKLDVLQVGTPQTAIIGKREELLRRIQPGDASGVSASAK